MMRERADQIGERYRSLLLQSLPGDKFQIARAHVEKLSPYDAVILYHTTRTIYCSSKNGSIRDGVCTGEVSTGQIIDEIKKRCEEDNLKICNLEIHLALDLMIKVGLAKEK